MMMLVGLVVEDVYDGEARGGEGFDFVTRPGLEYLRVM
jgi:hypothetical protein